MEEFSSSLWSFQEKNIEELKQRLFYTTVELEAVKAETNEEMKRNNEAMKQMLHHLKMVCQERDQLQNLLNKIMSSNDQQMFKTANLTQHHHQNPMMMPNKANSSITESNSSSPVESLFDPISSPEFSNINFQDHHMPNVDQATLVIQEMIKGKTLPEKGKLLQTVVEAGPLLHTLLVAGPLPRWRNPPPLQAFHIPPMVSGANQIAPDHNPNTFFNSPIPMLKQSQPYAEMACGSSRKMTSGGGFSSFGDVNLGSNFQERMRGFSPSGSNFSTIGKRQRLH